MQLGYYAFAVSEFEALLDLIPEPAQIDRQVSQASLDILADDRLSVDLIRRSETLQAGLIRMLTAGKASQQDLASSQQEREEIIRKIQENQGEIQKVTDRLGSNKRLITESETHKNWRAYAEYGRVRAMYLDNMIVKK